MKVLMVGLGGAGQRHVRVMKSFQDKNISIYAYRVQKRQLIINEKLEMVEESSIEEQYSITTVSSIKEGFKIGMDAVFICNPTSMHKEVIREAIKWKCPIFVEKPISNTTEDIKELVKEIQEQNICTMVGYQNRFHPCIKKTKELLEENKIGQIVAVNAEVCTDVTKWHVYEDYRNLYAVRKELGGGVVLTQAHELDYINYFMGMPQQVYALGGSLSGLETNAEDIASIILQYELNGNIIPVHLYEDYIQNPPSRICKIIGTCGKIEFDLMTNSISCFDGLGNIQFQEKYTLYKEQLFHEELQEFFQALEQDRDTCIPIKEGMESLIMAEAILKSIREHNIVEIRKEKQPNYE